MAKVLAQTARQLRSLPNQIARAGAKKVADPLTVAYRQASGGDGRLSGVPKMKAFKAAVTVSGDALARGRVTMVPPGPAIWVNSGTAPRPQGSGRHPGTKGKRTFERTARREIAAAHREMERLFGRVFD